MSVSEWTVVWDKVYYVPLALQCIYRRSNEISEILDGEEGSATSGRRERMEITWSFLCR